MILSRRAPLAILAVVVIYLLAYAAYAATIDVGQGSKFSRIQKAVDAAKPGDIINIANGTYFESVNVTKPLTLKGNGNTFVDASGQSSAIVLSADGITVERIHAVNSPETGIKVISNRNILKDNKVSGNAMGVDIFNSSHNILRNNSIFNNEANFEVMFLKDIDNYNDIDTSNLVDGKPIYYLNGVSDMRLDSSSNAGTVYCLSCRNITIKDLSLANNTISIILYNTSNSSVVNNRIYGRKGGIFLQNSINNIIRNNNVSNSDHVGIFLSSSDRNIVSGNNVSESNYGIAIIGSSQNVLQGNALVRNNYGFRVLFNSNGNTIVENVVRDGQYGIYIQASRSNEIYLNDFADNKQNAYSMASANIWNSTKPITYEYMNGTSEGDLGNFWSDYSGQDKGNDGIGDAPYAIGSDRDLRPIMKASEKYVMNERGL